MLRFPFLLCLPLLSLAAVNAQSTDSPPVAVLLDRAVLSGVGLQKIDFPDEPERDFFQRQLYRGADISVYVVSSGNRVNSMEAFPFDEFIYMLQGEAIVQPAGGATQLFRSRDYFFAHRGFSGDWAINGGEHYHYELSVIASQRADSSLVAADVTHVLFPPATLSGLSISLDEDGLYEETLQAGVELTVKLVGEAPRSIALTTTNEQLIHLLSGQITISNGEASQTFYSGDFFILPAACAGIWTSAGHGLLKYLVVEKS